MTSEGFERESTSVLPPPTSYEVLPRARARIRYDLLAVALAGAIGLLAGFLLGSGLGG